MIQEKENVCEETVKTEQGTEVTEKGSAVLGKFKDVNALAAAYGCLQAEFTRRSQRLKELEKMLAEKTQTQEIGKTVCEREVESGEADDGTSEPPTEIPPETDALQGGGETLDTVKAEEGETGDGLGENCSKEELSAAEKGVVAAYSTEELYERAVNDESVRLRIIGDYLSSLSRTYAPLTSGGRGTPSVVPTRAKSVADAGKMALRLFQKE